MEPATLSRPTGTVTFLFTDVEESSRRWEADPTEMARALRRHDSVLKRVIAAHGGFVFKTVGDAFCAAFQSAPDAVGAALDAQRELNEPASDATGLLRVRMALHSGQSEERDRDYFGPAVNRTARLLDIAHGGQVLLSGATASLTEEQLPDGAFLRDLGKHRLKDLSREEQVHQLIASGLPADFPALRSLGLHPNNLPLQLTSFIGRDAELTAVKALLSEHRLVTLIGTGGVGKTRLALQAGAQMLHDYADGVWFVDLSPVRDPQFVAAAVAKSFELVESPTVSMTDLVVGYLERRNALLIMDNCEHVVGEVAMLIEALLHRCKDVHILATSREPIRIIGEYCERVASLAVPESAAVLNAQSALTYGAVALFVERAKAVSDQFAITDDNVRVIADLCRRLDGIALAIELAAAHVKILSVEHLNQRLDDRFRILTGGSRTAMTRQSTMRATLDWSYDLLSEKERMLLRRLSVFADGWSMPAACVVCRDATIEEWEIVDGLAALVDKSLVTASVHDPDERFRMYESTRLYAAEKLAESGERETFERAHAAFFAGVAARSDATWETTPTDAWVAPLKPDDDNFRAALDFTLEKAKDPALGAAIVSRLYRYWWAAARQVEGMRWCKGAFSANDLDALNEIVVLRMWYGMSVLYSTTLMRREAQESATRAVELARVSNDAILTGWSLMTLGVASALMGDTGAGREHCKEASKIATDRGAQKLAAWSAWAFALNDYISGDLIDAQRTLTEQLRVAQQIGDEPLHGFVLVILGNVELLMGNPERALMLARNSLELYRMRGDRVGAANALSNIAPCHLALQQFDEVRDAARECLRLALDAQNRRSMVLGLEYLAAVGARSGSDALAARLLGFANAWYENSQTPRDRTEQLADAETTKYLRQTLGDALDAELAAGAALTEAQAAELGAQI